MPSERNAQPAPGPARRPRILIVGDGAVTTGFARVTENIVRPLHEEFEIHHLACGYSGDPHTLPWSLYPAGASGRDPWGVHRINDLIEWLRPELVFLLNDPWIVAKFLDQVAQLDQLPPTIAYMSVDAGPVDPQFVAHSDIVRRIFLYAPFARDLVAEAIEQHRAEHPDFRCPPLEVMPHGIDTAVYYRIGNDGRRTARKEIFPDHPEFEDAFIVLNANRNQPRKRIDLTIQGFADFAKDKPANVKLFLHMGARDLGWDVPRLVRRFGVDERTLMSTAESDLPGVSQAHLNLIYNACDVGVNTSMAEGWGLVNHEHAAAGGAQILPRHNVFADLWRDAAIFLDPVLVGIDHSTSTDAALVSPDDLAASLEVFYRDPAYLNRMRERAFLRATQAEFHWTNIAARWRQIFRESMDLPS